jgi:hypothetical protein
MSGVGRRAANNRGGGVLNPRVRGGAVLTSDQVNGRF